MQVSDARWPLCYDGCRLCSKTERRLADSRRTQYGGRSTWLDFSSDVMLVGKQVRTPFFSLSFCPCWLLVDFCLRTRAGGGGGEGRPQVCFRRLSKTSGRAGNETEKDEKENFIGCVFFADKKWARNFILVVISETADMRAAGCKWPSLWTSSAVFHAEWTRLPCHLLCRRPLALLSSVSQIEYHCNRLSVTRLEYWIFFWYLIEYFTECVGLFSAVSSILFPLNIFFLLNILRSSLARPLRMHYEI